MLASPKLVQTSRLLKTRTKKVKAKTMAIQLSEKVLAVIRQVAANKGNRFASLVYRAKESGELARHTILIGFSYHNSVVESLAQVRAMKFDAGSIEAQAQADLIASFEKTLAAHAEEKQNADYTKGEAYDDVSLDGVPVSGIRYNKNDGSFKLFGLSVKKDVLENGVFKVVKSSALVLAKNKIRRELPVGKFREYAIEENALAAAKMNGETLEM